MTGWRCGCCGEWHDELPFAYHVMAPQPWRPEMADDEASDLTTEVCVIGGEHFFVRALVPIRVVDADQDFEWGVWVSLSRDNFMVAIDAWDVEGREQHLEPMFGWLSTSLNTYEPPTLNLKTMVHWQPVGQRPFVEIEPTGHPLAVEQHEGITTARVQELAELLHEA